MKQNNHWQVATLSIRNASDMSLAGRKEIAKWLRKQANDFVKNGHSYSDNFKARYDNHDGLYHY